MKKLFLIIIFFSFSILFFSFFFQINAIHGTNMEPNFINGQTIVSKRFLLTRKNLQRSDVVLYYPKDTDTLYVGRIVALPSELIRIENGNVYLDDNNGQYRIEEEYLPVGTKTIAYQENEWFKVGRFEYFIIGDNREDKLINLRANFVHQDDIKAKVIFKVKK